MNDEEFAREISEFVTKYQSELWELRDTASGIYAMNSRRPVAAHFEGSQVFANYYINLDRIFRVPVLSATFFTDTGRQLTFDELVSIIPEKLDRSAISEREHEITGIPVFFIHPCKTEACVRPFVAKGANYFHVWLVRYGPFFLYRLPY
jgi:hypothetical protein